MDRNEEARPQIDLGDAVVETKGNLPPSKVDIGAGYRQAANGLSQDD